MTTPAPTPEEVKALLMALPAHYLIVYENGNGYHCGCCRRTWTNIEILQFESPEAAGEHASRVNANDDDIRVTAIYHLLDEKPIYET